MKFYDIEIKETPFGFMAYCKLNDETLEDFYGNTLFDTAQEAQELRDSVLFDFGTDEDNGMA